MRAYHAAIAAAAILTLSGCGNMASNRGLDSVHQAVVSRSNYTLDLNAAGGSLPAQEQRRLAEWFQAMDLGYGDRVSIDDPAGRNVVVKSAIEAAASRHGLLVNDVAPVTTGEIAPGAVRVVVTRSTAEVPGCPDWKTKLEMNYRNATSSNFGCAFNANVAAMVANKEDLVRGEPGALTTSTQRSDTAIKQYRETPPTGAQGLKQGATQQGGSQQ
ncbi:MULTISPECIES: CpaD family pilus assembly protein [Pseudomonadota]|jgi:pilus assembly protein CpaD|uniref:CpaD family pilus assembly protein n=1 Tax=Pseudomonadota TaxID=1224 RepID=UPI00076A8DC0|nr:MULTISPECIES: CpaD family pilus assembly protein [Pseudomonadota]MAF61068.1 pilus assembly protein CpaD [Blastomonas sp.]MBA4778263.1 CpaD family pilus assembly protein [Blastomonas sp.]MBY0619972.1 CpaD family pilus assembly protein [Sphingomonas ursincola]|tara:strand:- start:70106 stop:70750 length:645 start_codon:yes stop_codon:yes gene_type:complete